MYESLVEIIIFYLDYYNLVTFFQRGLSLRRFLEIIPFNLPPAPRVYISPQFLKVFENSFANNIENDDESYAISSIDEFDINFDGSLKNIDNKNCVTKDRITPDLVRTVPNCGDDGQFCSDLECQPITMEYSRIVNGKLNELKRQMEEMQQVISQLTNHHHQLSNSMIFQPLVTSTPAVMHHQHHDQQQNLCLCGINNNLRKTTYPMLQSPIQSENMINRHQRSLSCSYQYPSPILAPVPPGPPPSLPPPPPPPPTQNRLFTIGNKNHQSSPSNHQVNLTCHLPNMSEILKELSEVKLRPVDRSKLPDKRPEDQSHVEMITEALRRRFRNIQTRDTTTDDENEFPTANTSTEWINSNSANYNNNNTTRASITSSKTELTNLDLINECNDNNSGDNCRLLLRKVDRNDLPAIVKRDLSQ